MTSKLEICKQALSLLHATNINDFNDGSNNANICNMHYDNHINNILALHSWSFATKKIKLTTSSNSNDDLFFKYMIDYPSDCINIISIVDSNKNLYDDYNINISGNNIKQIYSNSNDLYLIYTTKTDESLWSNLFIKFAIYSFAVRICNPIKGNDRLEQELYILTYGRNNNGGYYAEAYRNDVGQQPNNFELEYNNNWVNARYV